MKIQNFSHNRQPQARDLTSSKSPNQLPENPQDPAPFDWASLGQAALRGTAIGACGALAALTPGDPGVGLATVAGGACGWKVMDNPQAAIGGSFIGMLSGLAVQQHGPAGLAMGLALGAVGASYAEFYRQYPL